jgi:hypothetical protein
MSKKKAGKKKDKNNPLGLKAPTANQNPHGLNVRWFWFVEFIIQTKGNAVESARLAGFGGENPSYSTLGVQGHRMLKYAKIKDALEDRYKEMTISSNQALRNLSMLARVVDVGDYTTSEKVYSIIEGESYLTGAIAIFDLERFKKDGHGHMIESITNTKNGPVIKLRSPESANVWIGKSQGVFTDNIKIEEIETKGYADASPDDWDATTEDISGI